MPDDKLVNYFKENMKNGYSAEQLKETLMKSGFDPKEIDGALNSVQNPALMSAQEDDKSAKSKPSPVPIREKYPYLFHPVRVDTVPKPVKQWAIAFVVLDVLLLAYDANFDIKVVIASEGALLIFLQAFLQFTYKRSPIRGWHDPLGHVPKRAPLWTYDKDDIQKEYDYEKNKRQGNK